MAVGPVKEHNVDMEKARRFVAQYRIDNVKETIRERHEAIDYYNQYHNFARDPFPAPSIQYTHVRMLSMEIEASMFGQIIDKVNELDELMCDPETAELISEARFIYRLKRGIF